MSWTIHNLDIVLIRQRAYTAWDIAHSVNPRSVNMITGNLGWIL